MGPAPVGQETFPKNATGIKDYEHKHQSAFFAALSKINPASDTGLGKLVSLICDNRRNLRIIKVYPQIPPILADYGLEKSARHEKQKDRE